MLILAGRRPRPTSKKNRRLVLAAASGCTLVDIFSIHPPFLVGHVIWKRLLFAFIFSAISPLIRTVGCYNYPFGLNNIIAYSVKVPF